MTLTFTHGGAWTAAAALVLTAAVFWQYISLRKRLSRGRSALIAATRAAVFFLLAVLAAGPVLVKERKERFRPVVAVGIDSSLSMALKGGFERSRLERAGDFLLSRDFQETLDGYYAEYFAFDEGTRRLEDGTVEALEAKGRWTDLGAAVTEGASHENAGAVILLTDGGHDPDEVRAALAKSPVPVIMVRTDIGEEARDVEIADVAGAEIAFTGQPVRFTATVSASGFDGVELPVILKEGGKVVSNRLVSFSGDQDRQEAEFTWEPPAAGRYHLTVEVPVQAGEETAFNNSVNIPVEVRRDKIRILLVSGRPSWNYRFVREALKGDPTVDLISFIILRSASDVVNVPQDELSLIPFPTKKIFLEELDNFDLIIFENFSFRFYFPQQYLANVADFVKKGGGFWMLGGPLSFARGGYAGTAVDALLPVETKNVSIVAGYNDGSYRARVTPGGRRHPLLRGIEESTFRELPPIQGFNRSSGVKNKAAVLMERAENGEPLLVLGRHGSGRTLALLTDSLWKWNFELAGKGRGNTFFLSLIRKAVRWSVGDPLMEPVRISVPQNRILAGDDLRGMVRAFSRDYVPEKDPDLDVELRRGGKTLRRLPVKAVAEGTFEFVAESLPAGSYEIVASVRAGDEVYGRGTAAVSSAWPAGEVRRGAGLEDESFADMGSGGHGIIAMEEAHRAAAVLAEHLARAAPPYRVLTEEKAGFGEQWWTFAVIFGLLSGEWFMRRRFGTD